MDAIVLAGGYATRLWPITRHRPKMLLPIGEHTVIGAIFDALEAESRIDEVYVSTNDAFAEEFETYPGATDYEKPQLSVEETTEEAEKFGVVGVLAQLIDRENLTEDTLVIAGDNNPDEPGWFIQWLQRRETVSAFPFEGAWFDIGTPARQLKRSTGSSRISTACASPGRTNGSSSGPPARSRSSA